MISDLWMGTSLILRWLHLVVRCRPATRESGSDRGESAVLLLGLGYLMALGSWLARIASPQPGKVTSGVSLCLITIGTTLRVAGQEALGRGFAWGATPRAERLVTTGVYRYFKHPLLLGYVLEIAAMLRAGRLPTSCQRVVLLFTILAAYAQSVREERALTREFGSAWRDHSRGKPL